MTLADLTREDFLRELYACSNGELRALALQTGVTLDGGPSQSKASIVHALLVNMNFRGLTELEAVAEQRLADTPKPRTKHPLTVRYEKVDSALALADQELYMLRLDLERAHPGDADEYVMMQQTRDDLLRIRKRLREKVKNRWSL